MISSETPIPDTPEQYHSIFSYDLPLAVIMKSSIVKDARRHEWYYAQFMRIYGSIDLLNISNNSTVLSK